jgi:hypothetical protein
VSIECAAVGAACEGVAARGTGTVCIVHGRMTRGDVGDLALVVAHAPLTCGLWAPQMSTTGRLVCATRNNSGNHNLIFATMTNIDDDCKLLRHVRFPCNAPSHKSCGNGRARMGSMSQLVTSLISQLISIMLEQTRIADALCSSNVSHVSINTPARRCHHHPATWSLKGAQ